MGEVGKMLVEHVTNIEEKQKKDIARDIGYSFVQVKTVQMGIYEDYDATNRFYLNLGFKEFEVIKI